MAHLTKNFHALLLACDGNFTKPSFVLFCALMTGWILSVRHRFITELIYSSDNIDNGHWSCFHRFFSHNVWSLDTLSMTIASLVIDAFVPDGVIVLALDDTLCRKRGLNLFGAGMHHDPLLSSKKMKLVSWGHVWVVVTLVISLPGDLYYSSIFSYIAVLGSKPSPQSGSQSMLTFLAGQLGTNTMSERVALPVLCLVIAACAGGAAFWFANFEYVPREDTD